MRGSILHSLLKWVLASSVSLLAIPVTLFIIIFSLYPDLTTVAGFKLWKLESYYDICDRKEDMFIDKNINILRGYGINNTNYNKHHLVIIDQTLSIILNNTSLEYLKKDLIKSVDTKNYKVDTTSINALMYFKLIEAFRYGHNCDTLHAYFYKGFDNHPDIWQDIYLGHFTPEILKSINYKYIPERNEKQITEFKKIFSIVQDKIKSIGTIDCITFLSDFYNETTPDLSDRDFLKLRKATGESKIILIALWNTEYSKKDSIRMKRQKIFIEKFEKYFQGVVDTKILYIDKYNDDLYTAEEHYNFLEFEENISLNTLKTKEDTSTIVFYSPISGSLRYEDAKIKLKSDRKFKWKIKKEFEKNVFIKFQKNCDTTNESRYIFNPWYEDECDSLFLSIKLEHDTKVDDLKFIYSYDCEGKPFFKEYNIVIRNVFINEVYKKNLKIILILFCILLIIIIFFGEILFSLDLYSYNSKYKHFDINGKWYWNVVFLSILEIGLLLLLYFECDVKILYIITLIAISYNLLILPFLYIFNRIQFTRYKNRLLVLT